MGQGGRGLYEAKRGKGGWYRVRNNKEREGYGVRTEEGYKVPYIFSYWW